MLPTCILQDQNFKVKDSLKAEVNAAEDNVILFGVQKLLNASDVALMLFLHVVF